MVDIHTHILPDVDDGSQSMTDSLLMAELALESGVSSIITTPHCNLPWEDDTGRLEFLKDVYQAFRSELAYRGLPLNLYFGMEIYLTPEVPRRIRRGELLSLNDTGRYLVEFDFGKSEESANALIEGVLDTGAKPIIAHAERYHCVQNNPELAAYWIERGCQIQLNKGSIFGSFGRRAAGCAMTLLCSGDVHYVASDAHSPFHRNTFMGDIYEFLAEEFSLNYAQRLLIDNPEKYLIRKE